jgi:hypothetical protein
MAVAKLKRPKEDRFEELAERIASGINERASKMNPRDGPKPIRKLGILLLACSVVRDKCSFHFPLRMTPRFQKVFPACRIASL